MVVVGVAVVVVVVVAVVVVSSFVVLMTDLVVPWLELGSGLGGRMGMVKTSLVVDSTSGADVHRGALVLVVGDGLDNLEVVAVVVFVVVEGEVVFVVLVLVRVEVEVVEVEVEVEDLVEEVVDEDVDEAVDILVLLDEDKNRL